MRKQYLVFSSFMEETLEELELKRQQAEDILEMRAAAASNKTLDIIAQKAANLALNQAEKNLSILNGRISDIEANRKITPEGVSNTTLADEVKRALAELNANPSTTLMEDAKRTLALVAELQANSKSTRWQNLDKAVALAKELAFKPTTSLVEEVKRALALVTDPSIKPIPQSPTPQNQITQTATSQPKTKSIPWMPISVGVGALVIVGIIIFVD